MNCASSLALLSRYCTIGRLKLPQIQPEFQYLDLYLGNLCRSGKRAPWRIDEYKGDLCSPNALQTRPEGASKPRCKHVSHATAGGHHNDSASCFYRVTRVSATGGFTITRGGKCFRGLSSVRILFVLHALICQGDTMLYCGGGYPSMLLLS